jgi:hypothetical protein
MSCDTGFRVSSEAGTRSAGRWMRVAEAKQAPRPCVWRYL